MNINILYFIYFRTSTFGVIMSWSGPVGILLVIGGSGRIKIP